MHSPPPAPTPTVDKLFFYSKSASKPPAGRGVNEHATDPFQYNQLNAISDWRKMLSNFWVAPFSLENKMFNTVEHVFQGAKIGLVDPEKGRLFSLDSNSELSRGSGESAQKARKMVMLTPAQLHVWDQLRNDIMRIAVFAKFQQHPELANVLLATGTAELWHGTRGTQPSRQFILETVRQELRGAPSALDM